LQVVLPAAAVPAGVAGANGAAATGEVAGVDAAFCLPPWPLQAPRPVAVEVVPSLQVVVAAVSSAWLGKVNTNINRGAARAPIILIFFTQSLPYFDFTAAEL
jgi:hypothetical protein